MAVTKLVGSLAFDTKAISLRSAELRIIRGPTEVSSTGRGQVLAVDKYQSDGVGSTATEPAGNNSPVKHGV